MFYLKKKSTCCFSLTSESDILLALGHGMLLVRRNFKRVSIWLVKFSYFSIVKTMLQLQVASLVWLQKPRWHGGKLNQSHVGYEKNKFLYGTIIYMQATLEYNLASGYLNSYNKYSVFFYFPKHHSH